MLVLSRRKVESLVIDGRVVVQVLEIRGKCVRLGIEAPPEVVVRRGELPPAAFEGIAASGDARRITPRTVVRGRSRAR
jgi:carbon storage regulator